MYLSAVARPPHRAPPGYQWVYEKDGLSGLGKFRLKKVVRAVTRVAVAPIKAVVKVSKKIVKSKAFKKIAPIALVAAGAYFAAPWFLKVASVIGKGAASMLLQRGAAGAPPMTEEEAQAQAASQTPPDWFAQAASTYIATKSTPSGGEVPPGVTPYAPTFAPAGGQPRITPVSYAEEEAPPSEAPASGGLPKWILPAGIAAGLLLFGIAARPRGR